MSPRVQRENNPALFPTPTPTPTPPQPPPPLPPTTYSRYCLGGANPTSTRISLLMPFMSISSEATSNLPGNSAHALSPSAILATHFSLTLASKPFSWRQPNFGPFPSKQLCYDEAAVQLLQLDCHEDHIQGMSTCSNFWPAHQPPCPAKRTIY
jgi:hypothetical protein